MLLRLRFIFIIYILVYCKIAIVNADELTNVIRSVVELYALPHEKIYLKDAFLHSNDKIGISASGVILRADGLIVTNYHNIVDKSLIKVVLADGRIYQANIINVNQQFDLALIQIKVDEKLRAINISDENNLNIGDKVYAIGNQFGLGVLVTSGIVSGLPRLSNANYPFATFIQTDTVMNPGNSGGALINEDGHLIGITSGIIGKVYSGIGFAVPASIIKSFLQATLSGEKIGDYWLGFSAIDLSPDVIKKYNITTGGVMIGHIYKDSPAAKIGLQSGDILISYNSISVKSANSLFLYMSSIADTTPVKLTIYRNNIILNFIIIPAKRLFVNRFDILEVQEGFFSNIKLVNNNNAISYNLGILPSLQGAVIYEISKEHPLYNLGLRQGDVLVKINNYSIDTLSDFIKYIYNQPNLIIHDIIVYRKKEELLIKINHHV